MVRETRHLWVGNLPENIREDRIRDHFKRYGRVQSVKLLPRVKDDEGSGVCATVSFMDIKSASKAHNNEQKLEDRALSTEYHEPAAIPGGSAAPIYASSPRFSHGPPDEITGFERSSHFYERRGEGEAAAYLRRPASTYHVSPQEPPLRGRTRDRLYRNGPYTPIIESVVSRNPATHHRSSWSYESASRYPPPSTTPEVSYPEDRREPTPVVHLHKKHSKSSRLQCRTYCRSGSNGSESGSNSGSSGSRSRSSSSSSQSGSSTCSSGSSSPNSEKSCSTHSHHGSLRSGVTLQSAVSTPHTNTSSPAVHGEDRRPLAICVRNLPVRSSDTSLKDGLFHEYKKHGKVTWVKVVGQGADRYALVCFKKADDVDKALHVSHDKLFFGCKIEVAPYQGYDVDDNEFRPYETEQDEFHPKATRTLFIGNLEKDITAPELRKHFDQFGEIIEIDIKKQGSASSYAFCQYCDIGSVVRAMRTLDGEHLGNNRIKLGFGKSMHTNCVWVDGVSESVNEKYLMVHFTQFGHVSQVAIDRSRGHALVFYDQIASAQAAVIEMRGVCLRGRKLQVDFASRECQEAFYDHLEKQSNSFENSTTVQSPQGLLNSGVRGFETPSSSSSSSGGGGVVAGGNGTSGRYAPSAVRFSASQQQQLPQQPATTATTRTSSVLYSRTGSVTSPGASSTLSPSTPVRTTTPRHQVSSSRFDFTSDYTPERRSYRGYDELANDENCGTVSVVVGPPDIRHLQKERVALLEQLEDCPSSGEEGGPRRRCKHRRSHSGEGSRPGTPLCDERPENLPAEPRRTPRDRPPDPLSLPLPRFASQVLSPRPAPPSPPASPSRPRSSSSDDSEPSPPSPEWEERLRSLDEKYEKWSGSRTAPAKVDATSLRIRHKLLDLDLNELQPSDIVKSVLAKRSVFDEDSKRLENFGEKYEPREFIPARPALAALRSRLDSCGSPLHSPATTSPSSSSSPATAGAKGLQYPFPSHPPVQPTTSVATTTAAAICASVLTTASSASPSVSAQPELAKTSSSFPTSCAATTVSSSRQFAHMSVNYPLPKIHSPASPSERRIESCEVSNLRLSTPLTATPSSTFLDKSKSVQKLTCTKNDKCDIASAKDLYPSVCRSVNICNRRDSAEDKEFEGRRRSRDETCEVKQNADCIEKKDILGEGDKTKDTEMCDRRKRRPSIDVKDSVRKDISDGSSCDKFKDNHPKDRRRDSVDISSSVHKDDVSVDISCSKLKFNETKKDCNSDNSEILSSTFESSKLFTDFENVSNKKHDTMERRKDSEENVRHSLIDPLDKKKDIFGVSSEKDRRRTRENIDSSNENARLKKVPDNLERNRELEADSRHRDGALEMRDDGDDTTKKTAFEPVERRKENHSEHLRSNEIPDKRKETSCDSQHDNTRHKEKKEHSSDKDRRRDKDSSEHLENSRHKSTSRKSPEINEIHKHPKDSERRRTESGDSAKNKDCLSRKESNYSDDTVFKHSESKKECDNQINRQKDIDKRKEIDVSFDVAKIIQKKESDALEHRTKESRKESAESSSTFNRDNDRRREDHLDQRFKDLDKRRHSVISDSVRHKEHDSSETLKIRESDKRRDGDYQEYPKHKEMDKKKESDCYDYNKAKDSDRKKECDVADTRQREEMKESEENIKHRDYNKKIDVENHEDIVTHQSSLDEDMQGDTNAFELLKNKENDKRKSNDFDFSRHKHSDLKKDMEIIENCKMRDFEKRKDYEISGDYSVHKDGIKKENEQLEVYKHKEFERRNDIFDSIKLRESERKNSESSESHRRKEDRRRDSETENNKYKDHSEKKKDFDPDKYKHRDLDRKREEKEKRRERENSEILFDISKRDEERRKEREADRIEKMRKNRDNDIHDRHKDINHDCFEKRKDEMNEKRVIDNHEKRKDIATSDDNEKKGESIKKEKRKERTSSSSWPAAIGCKRRLSSQDSLDSSVEEVKRIKPERRDSKDSGKSSSSSKKSSGEKHRNFTKMLEEKIKEDKEKEIHRKKKEEESPVENKIIKPGNRKEKRNSGEKRKEDRKGKPRRDTANTCSDTDGSGDDEMKASKKHSIFDIVDDEPAYISMYDKVKARSTKNMQKLEEEKRQERLKEKFNQLKQCRAKREEKKRSTSYDEDSDSERGLGRRAKLLITSSEEDGGSEGDMRMKNRKIMSDTSEDDNHKHNVHRISKPMRILPEDLEPKQRKIMSDTSEDDSLRMNILRVKSSRIHSFENDLKGRKITSDTSEDDSGRINMKSKITRINSDESETDVGFVDSHKTDDETPQLKSSLLESSDLFSNISEDHDNFGENEIDSDSRRPPSAESFRRNSVDSNPPSTNELPRKKSHKKKQKRQKNSEYNEGGMSNKRHSSKKDRRKSAHSRDGDDESKSSDKNKIRKKKSDRETTKRDEKMEDIFGPLSDDSDKVIGKWQVSQVYGSDSESDREVQRKREKKRRERKARELDEAGRALEAKLLDVSDNYISEEPIKTKKKKRKKSRDEKIKHHHKLDEPPVLPPMIEQNTNHVVDLETEPEKEPEREELKPCKTNMITQSLPSLIDSPPHLSTHNKKPDIPGFGAQVDENIHETAVKSISESSTKRIEPMKELEEPPSSNPTEEKSTAISQEETEDAVAALLMEDNFGSGFESSEIFPTDEETTKPDTPVSEPDLQIDTDTEDTFDPVEFSRSAEAPRTPEMHSDYYRQQESGREGLEERILALACPDNSDESQMPSAKSVIESPSLASIDDKSEKKRDHLPMDISEPKTAPKVKSPDVEHTKATIPSVSNEHPKQTSVIEISKRHDLPPIVKQVDLLHPVKVAQSNPIKPHQTLSEQYKHTLSLSENAFKSHIQALPSKAIAAHIPTLQPVVIKPMKQDDLLQERKQFPLQTNTTIFHNQHHPNAKIQNQIVQPSNTAMMIGQKVQPIHPSKLVTPVSQQPLNKMLTVHIDKPSCQPLLNSTSVSPRPMGQQLTPQPVTHVSQNKHLLSPTPPSLLQIHSSKEPVLPLSNQHQPSQVIQRSQMQQQQIILVQQKQEAQLHQHDHLVKPQQQFQHEKKEHHILQQKPTSQKQSIEENQGNPQKDGSSIVSEELKQKDHNLEQRKHTDIHNQLHLHIHTQNQAINQSQPKIVAQPSPTVISTSAGTSTVTKLQTPSPQLHPVAGSPVPAPITCAKEALSPREQDGLVKGSRQGLISPTVQHFQSQPSANQIIHRTPAPMTQALHKQPVFPVSNSSEVTKDSQPIAVYSNIHKSQNAIKDEKHIDPFDKIVELSQCKKDPLSIHSKASPTIHSLKQAIQDKHHVEVLNPKDLDFASCKNFKPISTIGNHIDYHKPVSQDFKQTKELVSEVKPLNTVIQDLTEKISKEKQINLDSIDDEKEKPIDLMVQEIHQRKRDALNSTDADTTKKLVKEEDSLEVKEIKIEPAEEEKPLPNASESAQLEPKETCIENINKNSELKPVDSSVSLDTKKELTLPEDVKTEDSLSKTSPLEVDESKPELESDIKELPGTIKEDSKVNMLRIKKEDIVDQPFSPDLVVAPSTPKMEEIESSVFVKPGESSTEPCDDETAKQDQDVPDETKDLKDDKDEEPLATLLAHTGGRTNIGGRGGRRRKAAGRGGGVVTRRTRLNNRSAASTPSADVYEFRDDSEEETGRPRLILTIKSPAEPPQPPPTQPQPPLLPPPPQPQPPPTTATAAAITTSTTGCSTRKSRRLQEKDVNRTTIDDTIEDVVRGTRSSTRRGAKATGLTTTLTTPSNTLETRKSPRRKQANRSQTPTKDDSPQSPPAKQSRPSSPTPTLTPTPTAPPATTDVTQQPTPSAAAAAASVQQQQSSPAAAAHVQPPKEQPADLLPSPAPAAPPLPDEPCQTQPPPNKEPMTLIDPVTGLLIPMQESEEGQYVPLNNNGEQVKVVAAVAVAAAAAAAAAADVDSGEPSEKRMRTTVVSLPADTSITSVTVGTVAPTATCAPPPPPPRPLTTIPPVRPGVGVAVVKPVPPKPAPPPPIIPVKPPINCVVTMPPQDMVRPPPSVTVATLVKTRPILTSPALSKPLLPPTTSITTTSATPTGIVKPSNLIMSPKSSVATVQPPVTLNRVVVAPSLTSVTNAIKSGIPPTQVVNSNIGSVGVATTPINHKAHLLQAVNRGKVPVAKVPTPMTPKAHILQSIGNAVNCNAREGIVGPGTPPPPHHGSLLTGSVASPPLRAHSQQPIVTGASSSRAICKPIVDSIKMEPLKMETGGTAGINLSASSGGGGCIVVPTASPQQRGQVMQAGLPVPAYEASLHGVVAELLPNPQWPRQSPPPAHQHPAPAQGEVVQHVNYIQPAHYVHSQLMYQQYLREAALGAAAYQFTPGVKAECDDAARGTGGSPPGPLELRRGSPHDRTTDSPQVATLYVHGPRHLYYEGPPPAHRPSQPRLQVATPPHASQVPPQADSLLMLLQRYPVMWQGLLALKNDQAAVQMHFVFGNPHVARDSLPCNSDGSTPPLRIAQRMRLEQTQVEGVARKMQMDNEHCMLLALPCGRDHLDVLQQSNNLQSGFITYLQQKQAAGIVNIAVPGSQQAAYVVHIFPSCDFANESLARIAPDLLHRVADIAHLLIVIATV